MEPEPSQRLISRVAILRPLRIRDFALLWTGMTVSMVGDGIYLIAIAWQVYALSNKPSSLALVGIAWSLPQVVFVIASGVLSDRLDRRLLMIAGDLIRLGAIASIGVLSIRGSLTLTLTVGLVVFYGLGQAVFQPSFSAIVPTIVPEEHLVAANSLAQVVRPFGMMLMGPLLGGVLVATAGPGWALLVDAGTFAFSAVMVAMIRSRGRPNADAEQTSALQDLLEGLRYVRRERWLLFAMLGATVSLLATWGPWETLVPFVVKNQLGGSARSLGLVFGAGGVGSVIAAIVMGQRGRLPRRAVTALYVWWAAAMFGTAAFGLVTHVWQAMLVAMATESSITVLVVIWFTLVQRLVPRGLLGRVMSLDWMISTAGVPLSFAIVGPAATAFGADATLIAAGTIGGIVTLLFMLLPGARGPERDGSLEDGAPLDGRARPRPTHV